MTEIQQRTAEQLFRTLGELKGGAMKFGQALSILEAALPEEMAAPYREHLTKLQDSAPPMPTQTVRDILSADLGPDWKTKLVWLDGGPTAAASIGQVHKGRWHDPETGQSREVAVKVQYPDARAAIDSDLKTLARAARTIAPLIPGVDIKPLIEEIQARAKEELDYPLEAEAQRTFAAAFAEDPEIVVPEVVGGRAAGAHHRVARDAGFTRDGDHERHPGGARPLRRALRAVPVLRPGPHRPAARRPAPGQLPDHPERRRIARPARGARLRRGRPSCRGRPAPADGPAGPAVRGPATATR